MIASGWKVPLSDAIKCLGFIFPLFDFKKLLGSAFLTWEVVSMGYGPEHQDLKPGTSVKKQEVLCDFLGLSLPLLSSGDGNNTNPLGRTESTRSPAGTWSALDRCPPSCLLGRSSGSSRSSNPGQSCCIPTHHLFLQFTLKAIGF